MDEPGTADLDYCYITTTGRRSGRAHTIEIWFAVREGTVYVLSGGREQSDWVRNVQADPTVGLRLGGHDFIARARIVEDPEEDELARQLLVDKYGPRTTDDLEDWRRSALPIAVDLPEGPGADTLGPSAPGR